MVGDEAGDFTEILDLKDGRVAIVMGDAPGFGPEAARLAERLRSSFRLALRATDDPVEVVARVDDDLADDDEVTIASAVCAVVDPAAREVTLANAGHLPPVVVTSDGAELIGGHPDPLLGIPRGRRALRAAAIPDDSALVIYTDGLIERRGVPLDESLRQLVEVCEQLAPTGSVAQRVADRSMERFGTPTDDASVVAVRLVPEAVRFADAVVLHVYVDPADLRTAALLAVVDDLADRLRGGSSVDVQVFDITAPSARTEEAGVVAAPTIARAAPGPVLRVVGWFRTTDDLAAALQLPLHTNRSAR
jgi:hypothetical protein